MAINTKYNRPFNTNPRPFNKGYIIGACRSYSNNVDIDSKIWGTIRVPDIWKIAKTRIERYGEYLFLIAEIETDCDDIEESDFSQTWPCRSLSTAMRYAVKRMEYRRSKENEHLKSFSKEYFINEIEEKNYLQQTLAIGGINLVTKVVENLGDDMLAIAFTKAIDINGSIPTAKEIFEMRDKLTDRLNR